jgi:membrane-associated HD superfamily phosphohydrolase
MNIPKDLIQTPDGLEVFYRTDQLFFLLGHSAAVGLILCLITYCSNNKSNMDKIKRQNLILSTSNIMYLTTGLTTIMILVNNNLARAFSIGAAIALVRFRVKLGDKGAAANILFAIIAGISCGLDEVRLAWIITGFYGAISFTTYSLLRNFNKEEELPLINNPQKEGNL